MEVAHPVVQGDPQKRVQFRANELSLGPRRAVAAFASVGHIEAVDHHQSRLDDGSDDQLRNARKRVHHEVVRAVVDEHDAHLASVVGVDGAGRVQHGDAVVPGQAGAWTHLGLEAERHRHGKPGRNRAPFSGAKHDALDESGMEVHAGRTLRLVRGKRHGYGAASLDRELHRAEVSHVPTLAHKGGKTG